MKQSLIQSQLAINAFMITMIEKDIKGCKTTIKDANKAIKIFKDAKHKYYGHVLEEKNTAIVQLAYGKKKLAKLVELQKSLKKQASRAVLLYRKQKRLTKEIGKNPWNVAELRYNLDRAMDEIIAIEYY